jgi:hypothetical protein
MLSRSIAGLALALTLAAPALGSDQQPADPHSATAIAADAHLAAAAKLQRIAMPREMTLAVVNAVFDGVSKRLSAGVDPAKAAKIDQIIRQAMTPTIDGLNAIVASHFATHFSDAQIGEYTAFFSQPIYARSLSEFPSIATELTTWVLDKEKSEIGAAFENARARVADGTPAAPLAPISDAPPLDAHAALAVSVFEHAQSDRAPLEEVLWRTKARGLKDVDDATKQKIHDAFIAEIAPRIPGYRLQIAEIYGRHFSDDELRQLDAYYSAPTYRTFMTELDGIMKEVHPEFLTWLKANVLPMLHKSAEQMKSEGATP